ncbi:hypothetical protein KUCAC02_005187 [Chaenocephalus aceratus]|uniref:Uncharacterized protein n=1 Tax=Chaenocephalus aceratus TaxID=36190 RepID=A0ACB9WMP2_CHAAC|nr:hypothetical protein KUCAC02_005187 [Chaenocephalus aceratus]
MFLFLSAAEWSSRTWISPWNRPAGRCSRLPEAEPQPAEDSGISDLSQSDSGSECLTSTGQFEDAGSIPSPVAELFLQVKEELLKEASEAEDTSMGGPHHPADRRWG